MDDDKIWIVREVKNPANVVFFGIKNINRMVNQRIVSVCVDERTAKLHLLERVNDIAEDMELENVTFEIERIRGGHVYKITEKDGEKDVSYKHVVMNPISLNEYIEL